MRISVIIPNFNHAAYVGQAIDSALLLEWPDVEVIVIDDGSTDASWDVISGYASRITTIRQPNSGQLVGCNKGFAASSGEIVIFLDSDDMLHPSLARELAAVWTPKVSKVQVQMRTVNAAGKPTGSLFPQYQHVPTAEQVRRWSATTTAYPTPPGSGNAYSRWFLDRIFPLVDTCGTANDSYCLAAAPFLGDVLTIAKPLVSYRIHDGNQGAMDSLDVRKLIRQLTRARQREDYARDIAARVGIEVKRGAVDRNLNYLGYRLASVKLEPKAHPLAGDSVWRVMRDVWTACFSPQGVGVPGRVTLFVWALLVALLPVAAARLLVLWRFAPTARPTALRRWLARLRVLQT